MRILSILALSLILGGLSNAQQKKEMPAKPSDSPAAPMDGNKGKKNSSSTVQSEQVLSSPTGVRFVLKSPFSVPPKVYMPLAKNRLEEVELRAGLPGRRSVYPKGRKISLYSGLNEKGVPSQEHLMVSKQIPDGFGSKTLALLGKNSAGKITMDFIDEREVPFNCVYIRNMTGRTYTLEINPRGDNKKEIVLAAAGSPDGKDVYIFGKDRTGADVSKTTPANLTYMTTLKNGKKVKIKDRGMMLTTYPTRKVIMFISPDASGKTAVLSELMLFKERATAPAKDR